MKCPEVKKYLEQYMDGAAHPAMKRSIREHIASCGGCTRELGELMAYKKKIKALKKYKAPDGFLQGITKRIDEPSFYEKIIRALFLPLKFKVPLEAAGVLAVVFIIFFIYSPADFPARKSFRLAQIEKKELPHDSKAMRSTEAGRQAKDIAPSGGVTSKYDIKSVEAPAVARNEAAAPEKKKIVRTEYKPRNAFEIALLVPVEPQEITRDAEMAGAGPENLPSSKGMADDNSITGVPPAGEKSEMKSAEEAGAVKNEKMKADKQAPAAAPGKQARANQSRMAAVDKIKEITARLGGKILIGKYNEERREIEYLIIDIPAAKYPQFIAEIGKIGTLMNPAPEKARKHSRMQQLKIELISE